MYPTFTSARVTPARAFASLAFALGTMSVAACRDNAPVSPATPVSASPDRSSGNGAIPRPGASVFISWSVTDPVNNLQGPSYFQLRDSTYNTVLVPVIQDNSALDKNATLGKFTMELPAKGSYFLCETLAPSGYFPPTPNCKWFMATGGLTPQAVGTFVNNPTYSVYFNVTDPYGNPLPSTSFVVKREYYPNNDIHVSDNILPDRDPVTGKYFVVLPAQSWYVICQHDAPYGYDVPADNCSKVSFFPKPGIPVNGGTFVNKPWPVAR